MRTSERERECILFRRLLNLSTHKMCFIPKRVTDSVVKYVKRKKCLDSKSIFYKNGSWCIVDVIAKKSNSFRHCDILFLWNFLYLRASKWCFLNNDQNYIYKSEEKMIFRISKKKTIHKMVVVCENCDILITQPAYLKTTKKFTVLVTK